MKWFLMAVCLLYGSINLFANTNPFMLNTNQRDFQVQQKNKGKKFLSTESIQLPSNARELKSVTLTFQNLDGTLEDKELHIDKTIDWHYPIKITQEGAIRNIAKRYFSLNDFEFFMEGSTFVISSPKHRIIRHFLLVSPTTIIVDFSRDGGSPYDAKIGTGEKIFADVGVNTKNTFYRIAITLDGVYQYTLKSGKNNTHTITVR